MGILQIEDIIEHMNSAINWKKRIVLIAKLILHFRTKELMRRSRVYILKRLIRELWLVNVDPLQIMKDLIIEDNFESTPQRIRSGLFEGLILETDSWSRGDLVSIISGNYEREVLEWIYQTGPFETIINVGAGTGYYPLGLIHVNLAKNAVLFEVNSDSIEIARENAERNGLQNFCTFYGKASESNLLATELEKNSLVIIDIEGGEFELLTDRVLNKFASSSLCVEIHDFTDAQKNDFFELLERSARTHSIEILNQSERNPHIFPEILQLDENSRWLLMSEGRPGPMSWLCLSPLI